VHREVYHQVPPRVEYSPTKLGVSLNKALLPLGEWEDEHMTTLVETHHRRRAGAEG